MTEYRSTSDLILDFQDKFKRPINTKVVDLSVSDRLLLGKIMFEECVEYVTKGLGLAIVMPNPHDMQYPTVCYDSPEDEMPYLELNEGQRYDPVESADGLGDITWVAYFNSNWHGWDLDKVIQEIYRSNMSKLGEDGEPIINGESPGYMCAAKVAEWAREKYPDEPVMVTDDSGYDPNKPMGKILKGPNYSPPNIAKVIGVESTNGEERAILSVSPSKITEDAKLPKCPDHPDADYTGGYGLAGGGFGAYKICDTCGRLFGKVMEEE